MRKLTRRTALLGAGAAAGYAASGIWSPSVPSTVGTTVLAAGGEGTFLNDASLLSRTPVAAHAAPEWEGRDALLATLRREMAEAAQEGQPLCVSAARHSMGAHAIPRAGRAVTLPAAPLEVDTAMGVYRASAGTRWSDAIPALDAAGLSPDVTQSNNDFGIAATFGVNAHGWSAPRGPMAATVREVEMLLADGSEVVASRTENPDLFRMAAGGYGLAGIVTAVVAEAAANRNLAPAFEEMPARAFGPRFAAAVREEGLDMAYGRLSVDREGFFEDALLITYRDAGGEVPAASGSTWVSHAASRMYRWQLGDERWKRLRWGVETGLAPMLGGGATRNSLINEPVRTLSDRIPAGRTDILHEYFVAPERFAEWVGICRNVIRGSYQELLNITLRWIDADDSAMLGYAPVDRIAGVMSFSQEMTARAEADMARMTAALIEGCLSIGGTYYLPYRPHASVEQYVRAYPEAGRFAAMKREVDPGLLFRNGFWDNYARHA